MDAYFHGVDVATEREHEAWRKFIYHRSQREQGHYMLCREAQGSACVFGLGEEDRDKGLGSRLGALLRISQEREGGVRDIV